MLPARAEAASRRLDDAAAQADRLARDRGRPLDAARAYERVVRLHDIADPGRQPQPVRDCAAYFSPPRARWTAHNRAVRAWMRRQVTFLTRLGSTTVPTGWFSLHHGDRDHLLVQRPCPEPSTGAVTVPLRCLASRTGATASSVLRELVVEGRTAVTTLAAGRIIELASGGLNPSGAELLDVINVSINLNGTVAIAACGVIPPAFDSIKVTRSETCAVRNKKKRGI